MERMIEKNLPEKTIISNFVLTTIHRKMRWISGAYARVHGRMAGPANVSVMNEPDNFVIGRQNSGSEMTMFRQGVPPRDTWKSPVPVAATSSATPFKENQLKQLGAQYLVFLAFR
jgi:hypothetical protein